MKISYNWLKNYIKTEIPIKKIAEILTDTGLEVEATEKYEAIKGSLNGVIVGKVLECEKHPNADKLKVTKVELGEGKIEQIVCGAPNVAAGQTVAVATVGTKLYDKEGKEFEIKAAKIRGEHSNGMICAEDELGLGESHEGIIVLDEKYEAGTPLKEIYSVSEDYTLEIGLTPNRTDATCHFGVARDLFAGMKQRKLQGEFIRPEDKDFSIDLESQNPIKVEIENPDLCPRYSGIYIKDVTIAPSPEWLQNYLKAIDLHPINNVVDITNFILHAFGQPLHAFDADKISENKIIVGTVSNETPFTTLDGVERKISEGELLIKDGKNTPLCIAGVFGGQDSGVSATTKNIFLESAYFNPISIRKTSKKHGLNTDSSFRFERGTDPNNTLYALKQACIMLKNLASATIVGDIVDLYPNPVKNFQVVLRYHKIDQILGQRIHRSTIKEILKSLEIEIISDTNDTLDLRVPLYRADVTREIDVIEEIARIYGYNHIDIPEKFSFAYQNKTKVEEDKLEDTIAQQLKYNGFNEVLNNSLTQKREENDHYVQIINPLSNDLAVMRQSLLFGILGNISYNLNRNQKQIKFFEFGKTYFKYQDKYEENKQLAIALCGNFQENNWIAPQNTSTFYHLKGVVSQVLHSFGLSTLNETPWENSTIQEGIELKYKKETLAKIGVVSAQTLKEAEVKAPVFYAEIEWTKLVNLAENKEKGKLVEIPKFPGSRRDLALLLDKNLKYIDLYKLAFETERKLLKSVDLFDVYEGKNLPEGKKSYALSFYLQDENKTLTDKDIDKVMSKLADKYKNQFDAELRN